MALIDDLRKLGFSDDQIASGTIDGKPIDLSAPKERRARGMNKTEQRYAMLLEGLKLRGLIRDWRFEPLRLRLADGTYYRPDFLVIHPDGACWFVEIKGFLREAARVRFNVARELYPWWRFVMLRWNGEDFVTLET